jgi:hypothetical protein
MFSLGLIPVLNRNIFVTAGLVPSYLGQAYSPLAFIYALGGILMSHPFEVARVIIQHNGV